MKITARFGFLFAFLVSVAFNAVGAEIGPLFTEDAIDAETRALWAAEAPMKLAAAEVQLQKLEAHSATFFKGMENTFQHERYFKRLELARRALAFARRELEKKTDPDALAYAMLSLRDFDVFREYARVELESLTVYPLNPSVTPTRLSVKDFGAVGDGRTDDSGAFQKATDAVRQLAGKPCVLVIPPGSYYLAPPSGHYHWNISGVANLVVDGGDPEKTELVFGVYDRRGVGLSSATNSTLRNIQLRCAKVPFAQTTILSVDRENETAVVQHDPWTLRPDSPTYPAKQTQICAQFDAQTHHEIVTCNPFFDPSRVEDLGGGRFRIGFDREKNPISKSWVKLHIGAKLILPDRKSGIASAEAIRSRLCNFENVWVRNSREAGIMPSGGWMITAYRCRTFPLSDRDYLSTNADSFFNWRGSHLSHCYFHNMNDDGCNSMSRGVLITAIEGGDTFIVRNISGRIEPGDFVEVLRPTEGRGVYLGRIRSVVSEGALSRVTMEGRLPTGLRTQETQKKKDLTTEEFRRLNLGLMTYDDSPDQFFLCQGAGFGYLCLENDIGDLRNVACQLQCPHSLIEGNRFSYANTAMALSTLLMWQEGSVPYDIAYRGNTISHCGNGFSSEFGLLKGHRATTAPFRGILLENNFFEDIKGIPIFLNYAVDVQLKGNVFKNCPNPNRMGCSRDVIGFSER